MRWRHDVRHRRMLGPERCEAWQGPDGWWRARDRSGQVVRDITGDSQLYQHAHEAQQAAEEAGR